MNNSTNLTAGVTQMAFETVNTIGTSNTLIWIKWLALIGIICLIKMAFDVVINIIYLLAYLVGTIKWLREKAKNKKGVQN